MGLSDTCSVVRVAVEKTGDEVLDKQKDQSIYILQNHVYRCSTKFCYGVAVALIIGDKMIVEVGIGVSVNVGVRIAVSVGVTTMTLIG